MPPDLKTWTCGQCQRTVLVPPEGEDGYLDTILRIREHRFGHSVDTLMHGSDEDLWGLSGEDAPMDQSADACLSSLANLGNCAPGPPVDSDDVAPVLEGIEALLRDDLPRARRLWYPINPDGSFNREEDK